MGSDGERPEDTSTVRVLVCGGRNFSGRACVYRELDRLLKAHGSVVLIEGGASGADKLAADWVRNPGWPGEIEHLTFSADWGGPCRPMCVTGHRRKRGDGGDYCPAAGNYRNQEMLDKGRPDLVLAFPGNRGTADMVLRSRAADIDTYEIKCSHV